MIPVPPTSRSLVVVDDDENDIFFLQRLLAQEAPERELVILTSSVKAIEFFNRVANGERSAPVVVFLDIKMPMKTGLEVLQAIRSRRELDDMSVCMLSGSSERSDVAAAKTGGAQCYLEKPPVRRVLTQVLEAAAVAQPGRAAAFDAIKASLLSPETR